MRNHLLLAAALAAGIVAPEAVNPVGGKWGPQSFHGDLGNGRGPRLEFSSVDGGIHLRSNDGVHRDEAKSESTRRRGHR